MGREVFTDGDEWEERCSLMEMSGKRGVHSYNGKEEGSLTKPMLSEYALTSHETLSCIHQHINCSVQ